MFSQDCNRKILCFLKMVTERMPLTWELVFMNRLLYMYTYVLVQFSFSLNACVGFIRSKVVGMDADSLSIFLECDFMLEIVASQNVYCVPWIHYSLKKVSLVLAEERGSWIMAGWCDGPISSLTRP